MLALLFFLFALTLLPFGFIAGFFINDLLFNLEPNWMAVAKDFLDGLPQMLFDLIGGLFNG